VIRYLANSKLNFGGHAKMKQFLKLASIVLYVCSLTQVSVALASVTAKCPDNELLAKMGKNAAGPDTIDSQGISWAIDKQGNPDGGVVPSSFSGWETAEGLFQQKGKKSQYTPYLNCSVSNFHVAGFLPVGPYQSCTLEGKTLEQDKYSQCSDAKSCELICS
jgi:hypothetical protein